MLKVASMLAHSCTTHLLAPLVAAGLGHRDDEPPIGSALERVGASGDARLRLGRRTPPGACGAWEGWCWEGCEEAESWGLLRLFVGGCGVVFFFLLLLLNGVVNGVST